MDLQKKNSIRLLYFLSFLLPFSIGTLSFVMKGVVPFGAHTILQSDAWGQYYPYHARRRRGRDGAGDCPYRVGRGLSWGGRHSFQGRRGAHGRKRNESCSAHRRNFS